MEKLYFDYKFTSLVVIIQGYKMDKSDKLIVISSSGGGEGGHHFDVHCLK